MFSYSADKHCLHTVFSNCGAANVIVQAEGPRLGLRLRRADPVLP